MRKWMMGAMLAGALATGCSKQDDAAAQKEAEQKAAALLDKTGLKAVAGKAADVKNAAQALGKPGDITLEDYEKLMLDLAQCELTKFGIDRKCSQYKAFTEGTKNRGALMKAAGGGLSGLGKKHLKHENASVRYQAAKLLGSLFGSSKDSQELIVESAKAEQDPRVVRAMLSSVGSAAGKNPAIKDLVLELSKHEDEDVRLEASTWLTSTWADGTAGTLERAMEMVKSDSSKKVRGAACRGLGKRADEKVLPTLDKLTKSAKDNEIYADCFQGLIAMWSSPVPHKKPSQKAYKLTLARLKAKPRNEEQPPWIAFSSLQWANKDEFQKAAPWFKKADLIAALTDVVKDTKSKWMARTSALGAMQSLKAEKQVFEGLAKVYAGKTGTDAQVEKKIKEILAKL